MTWRKKERTPLPKGAEITIGDITVVNADEPEQVLKGSSCLVYHGYVKPQTDDGLLPNAVIIKEFYPDIKNEDSLIDIIRDEESHRLIVSEMTKEKTAYADKMTQFMQGIKRQKELASSEAMEIGVKILAYGAYGDSYYVISLAHRGEDLQKRQPETLKDKLNVAMCVVETMQILHELGYMMPDFKPANLLWIQKPNLVKIIDTDSLIPYNKPDEVAAIALFGDVAHMSPDIRMLQEFAQAGISKKKFEQKKKYYLKPISDMYAIGAYLYTLFWDDKFEKEAFSEISETDLVYKLIHRYEHEDVERGKLSTLAYGLVDILDRLLVTDLLRRKRECFVNAGSLMDALSEVQFRFTSQKYIPRKEIAKANATFVSYNMLQKHPLYQYANREDGILDLQAALVGSHAMRKEMLSAIISIGQMLDAHLTVHVAAEDAKTFWEEYISIFQNGGLRGAITWSVDGKCEKDEVDAKLVDRSLAHINVITQVSEEVLLRLKAEGCRYFALLEEDEIQSLKLAKSVAGEGIFVGRLQEEETEFYPISARCYSEFYNEKMFEEKIFDMGLKVHAYYCGCLDELDNMDIDQLKKEFSENLYNVASSERCALHAMYKMASVGIYGNQLGRARKWQKILEDPEKLEQLAWLEHLSWSAHLLTSGAYPLSMEAFDGYAYKGSNDWKNTSVPGHLLHPLLVSAKMTIPETDWSKRENYDVLDELDKVSFEIYDWFRRKKEYFQKSTDEVLGMWHPKQEEETALKEELCAVICRCIDGIGQGTMNQDKTYVNQYKKLMNQTKIFIPFRGVLENEMRPVVDSYKDRDYKELDRKLVYAAEEFAG